MSTAARMALVDVDTSSDAFDTSLHFDRWLQELQDGPELPAVQEVETEAVENSDIYFGSFPGSVCDLSFDGVLHLDGYSIGNVTSPDGTLVLSTRGRLEGDVVVSTAVIRGCVIGDIIATESVVLEGEARVTGKIRTPELSVKWGALIDGDWLSDASLVEEEVRAEEPALRAVAAAA